jgi:dTDP-4-dehydrorhamnose reductase
MKKVLIIGAQGMLGQELVKVFSAQGGSALGGQGDKDYKVIAWDREELDITDQKQVNEKITALKPRIIINAAAYNAVDEAESKAGFKLAKKINGLAPGYLAKVAKKIKAILVHYSSQFVFDGNLKRLLSQEPMGCTHSCTNCALHNNQEIGYAEDTKPNPINNYGKSKLQGEKAVIKNIKSYYVIRLSRLFGKPAISEGGKKSFFDIMLKLGKNPPVGGVKGVDEEIDCFTYAPDLAKKTKEILDSRKPFGIYHVTNSGSCTWYEAVVELYDLAGIKTKVIPVSASEFPRPAQRPAFSVLLNTKLNPLRSWKEALNEYLKNLKFRR